jgi:bifunctional aspartokinase / homoserine dehydrogenase 1
MKVLKFGGSSVAKPERIQGIVAILKRYQARGDRFTVVFSAFGGVTDGLIDMAKKAENGNDDYLVAFEQFRHRHIEAAQALVSAARFQQILPQLEKNCDELLGILRGVFFVHEASLRTMDYVVSFGERMSAFIIAHTLDESGVPAEYLDARFVIKTDKNFSAAKVDFAETDKLIADYYAAHADKVQIVTGFIGSAKGSGKGNDFGLTTTLGRGGSDYTAAIIAAGLDAEVIEIWTDVDGVLTADPRKVKKAFTIPTMTYAEAMEMSHFGAKVIYPPTLQPAFRKQIPLYIKNTFNPDFIGTLVSDKKADNGHAVQGISSISHVSLLTLGGSGLFGTPGVAGRLFAALAAAGINVILITQGSSESSISFAVQPSDAKKAKKTVEKAFEFEVQGGTVNPLSIEDDLAVVAIVGESMRYRPGIAGLMFSALGKNGVNCIAIAQGSSELNISVVVPRSDETKALTALHEAFFLSDAQTLHVYMTGVGLIGSTLLRQIADNAQYLKEKRFIEIKVVGLSNSKQMIFDENGIDLKTWESQLAAAPINPQSSTPNPQSTPSVFVEKMLSLNLANTIFVDCTASKDVATLYQGILDSSISISTANKIANSSSFASYQQLKATAIKRSMLYRYETNVGAGLPVISTLSDLIISGDRILKIEGVLSGSLSFIFNNFKEGVRFSDIVGKARDLGYTEPDPRIDLTGADVRRKLVILAREAGIELEQEDVDIKNFLPESCLKAATVDDFFMELEKSNAIFSKMLADTEGGKLRMIAKIEGVKATIGLEKVEPTNPFSTLDGSDNMIVFTTERYRERPLVVRGPGAGAEVTAAGVFAEIIAIGNYLG